MKKKILFASVIIAIVVIVFGFYIVRYSLDPFGVPSKYSLDPFGAPPKGSSLNCGPENRYKFDVTINSKEDFVNFIKTHEIDQRVRLDNFKNINQDMDYEDIKSAQVDWNKVLSEVKTENAGFKTIYMLKYEPDLCFSVWTLKMTSDGHVSVYGCCGI